MTLAHAMTLRQARDLYLEESGFSTDTYVEEWVDIPFGPLPLRLPNTDARKRVLPVHDIHHALTGYKAVSGVSGNLSSIGSDTLNNLMTFWAEAFKKYYPSVGIEIEGKGSSTAPPALIAGTSQLGPMKDALT